MVVSNGPAFTAPEEDIDNILQEDLVFEIQFDVLVVEEMTSAHFSACLDDSIVYVVVGG